MVGLRIEPPERPRQDSNLRAWLRRPLLYPLSYGGMRGEVNNTKLTCSEPSAHPQLSSPS